MIRCKAMTRLHCRKDEQKNLPSFCSIFTVQQAAVQHHTLHSSSELMAVAEEEEVAGLELAEVVPRPRPEHKLERSTCFKNRFSINHPLGSLARFKQDKEGARTECSIADWRDPTSSSTQPIPQA